MKKITFGFLIISFFMCQVNYASMTTTYENIVTCFTNLMFPNQYADIRMCTNVHNPTFSDNDKLPENINKYLIDNNYFLTGAIDQTSADDGFDDIYTMTKEWDYMITTDIEGEESESNEYFITINKHYKFRIDDYSDVPSYTNYRGVIKADDTNYVDGWLFKNVEWSISGAGTINIPADTDVFEVVTLNNADLDPGIYCIQTALDSSAPVIPLEITVYEANGNNYGTQIGWTNAFVNNSFDRKQLVFIKLDSAKKIFVKVNSTMTNFQGKYKIKCVRSTPIILVHGIRAGPKDPNDESNFEELNIILNKMGYTVKYLYYDSIKTDDPISEIIERYKNKIEDMYTDSGTQKVTIIAHSFGATLTDLCIKKYLPDKVDEKIEQVITIGGVHRGSPFANIWMDTGWVGTWLGDTTPEMKNALEIGGAGTKMCSAYKYNDSGKVPLITFNGKWGDYALIYYDGKKDKRMPRHFEYGKLDAGMVTNSDGMVPNYSACPGEITSQSERRLVYSYSSQGMAHDDSYGDVVDIHTETHIWDGAQNYHGFFITLTNFLAGGDIQNTDGNNTATVPQSIGVVCKLYNLPFNHPKIYAEKNGVSVELWVQDVDDPLLNQQEEPYYILISEAGNYSINKITYIEQVYQVFIGPIYVTTTLTTNLGTMTVVGGQVKYDN